jgi:signal transduction histidine kinase/streptogramin lyase
MPLFREIFLSVLLLLISTILVAQTQISRKNAQSYFATHWGLNEGLSQAETYCILKDKLGFIWVGTRNGLNRFDGNTFKVYYNDPRNPASPGGDNCTYGMSQDSLGNIWIGTNSGLSRYDLIADSFTNFIPDDTSRLPNRAVIVPFWATAEEVLCIEQESTITAYNVKTFTKKILGNFNPYFGLMAGPSPGYSIFDSASHSVWVTANDPNLKGKGILRFDLHTKKIEIFPMPCFINQRDHNHMFESMKFDKKRNCIWLNTEDGLVKFSIIDKKFYPVKSLLNCGRWVGIDISIQGEIWVATQKLGIVIYNPEQDTYAKLFANDSSIQHKVSEANARIYCDKEGMIWSGFWDRKGIYQISPYKPSVKRFTADFPQTKNGLSSSMVTNIINAGNGKMWVGTTDGLNVFDVQNETFTVLRQKQFIDLPGNLISPIFADTLMGAAWAHVGSDIREFQLYKIDMKTLKATKVIFKNNHNADTVVHGAFPYKKYDGTILICVLGTNGTTIFKLDKNSNTAIFAFRMPEMKFMLASDTDDKLVFFSQINFPFFTPYAYINERWQVQRSPFDSIKASAFYYDETFRRHWLGARGALFYINEKMQIVKKYGLDDGMPDLNIVGIYSDKHGNIWFHTDRSLHQLNLTTGKAIQVTDKDGFLKQDYEYSWGKSRDNYGHLYFPAYGYGTGFDIIYPEKFSSSPSSVYFKAFTANQKHFHFASDHGEIRLGYNQNNLNIETGIIDFYSRGKSRIRYLLKGHDSTWIYAPYYFTIRYEGLPHGKYELILQASNSNNQFNGQEKKIVIVIEQAFYSTIWAFLLYATTFAGVIIFVSKYRSRSLKRKNTLLEKKVEERTSALKLSLDNLTTTQAQLIHAEKMASLGELTAGIAHEIQNPLNFVNNFSEINKELIEELKEEQTKSVRDYEIELQLLDDINENLEKILTHGRRADNIVKGMLQHSRQQSGKKEPEDINELALEYLRLSYHGQRAKDKSFLCVIESELDGNIGKIEIAGQDISRVFLNIFNNAFYAVGEKKKKYPEQFEPHVKLQTKAIISSIDNMRWIEIRIFDNGLGIPQKIIDKVFQPFFTTKPTGQGTGLGLSISYDIITKIHNGKLWVETKEGEFTEFIIQLPA